MIFNLLGKTILENSIGALKHHLKKKEVARNTEIECQKEIQIERIKQSGGSFKDEIILIWFLVILSLPLIGETERFMNWAKVLSAMPSEIFYIFGAIVAASFGIKISNIFKKLWLRESLRTLFQDLNQRNVQDDTLNLFQKEYQIKKNIEVKVDED